MASKFIERPFEVKKIEETGEFEGVASPFGVVDFGGDIVMHGAFAKSLQTDYAEKKRLVPMLWQHNQRQPIGVYTSVEEKGDNLVVRGACNMKVQQGREAHALMEQGALSGLSIGYDAIKFDFTAGGELRQLHEVKLYEISPVTFPMADQARVTLVKSLEEAGSLSDCEALLRDAGFSKSEALAFVARVKSIATRSDSAGALDRALAVLRNT
jgi:HK97 family phage prohead protease